MSATTPELGADRPASVAQQRDWRGRLRQWGWRRFIYWGLMTLLARLGLRLHRVSTAPYQNITAAAVLPENYTTRYVSVTELLERMTDTLDDSLEDNGGLTTEFLSLAGERGDICVGNFYLDALVGYSFHARKRAPVTAQLDIIVPKGFSYVYKSWTHADHRRQHLNKARANLHRNIPETPVWYIETHNYASLLTGYRYPAGRPLRVGFIGWWRVAGYEIPFTSRRARRIGLRLVGKKHSGRLLNTEV